MADRKRDPNAPIWLPADTGGMSTENMAELLQRCRAAKGSVAVTLSATELLALIVETDRRLRGLARLIETATISELVIERGNATFIMLTALRHRLAATLAALVPLQPRPPRQPPA